MNEIHEKLFKYLRLLQKHKERYLRAWILATGLDPRDACIYEMRDGVTIKTWIGPKSCGASEVARCCHCGGNPFDPTPRSTTQTSP